MSLFSPISTRVLQIARYSLRRATPGQSRAFLLLTNLLHLVITSRIFLVIIHVLYRFTRSNPCRILSLPIYPAHLHTVKEKMQVPTYFCGQQLPRRIVFFTLIFFSSKSTYIDMDIKKKIEAIPPQRTRKELWEQLVSAGCKISDSSYYSKCQGLHPIAQAGPDGLWRLEMAAARGVLKDHSGNLIFGGGEETESLSQRKLVADVKRKEALARREERIEEVEQGKLIPRAERDKELLTLIGALQLRINAAVDDAAAAQVVLVGGKPERAHALAADLKQLVRRAIAGLLAGCPLRVTIDPVQSPPQDDQASH